MHVSIDCDGCEDNVRKALEKLKGVHHVSIDRMHGKVTVTGSVSQRKALRAARRTGKLAVLWPSAYNNPSYHQAHAMRAYYQYQYQANKPAQAQQHQYYSSVQRAGKNSGGISAVATKPAGHQYPQSKASSYNYHVHGYYDSELYGYYHDHEQPGDVVPAAVRSYFSDENPSACSIM
ncbi:heavy metal-associated isoprenylated plant protein 29 isoform X2 [Zea mays]|nr:heavy metal-associated isoprenylated plant protein 29 isoform X2 [Zea mays]|eukprot:XP_008659609.1 heavy metal-associated isoprenylated plant protein 29 isoform X2 [Zea mays]